jgi:hypothetical protein
MQSVPAIILVGEVLVNGFESHGFWSASWGVGFKSHRNGRGFISMRYRLRYRDAEKKQHWQSCKTRSYEAAVRAAAAWERELEAGDAVPDVRTSSAAFRQRCESEFLPGLAVKTRQIYRTAMNALEAQCKPDRLSRSPNHGTAH